MLPCGINSSSIHYTALWCVHVLLPRSLLVYNMYVFYLLSLMWIYTCPSLSVWARARVNKFSLSLQWQNSPRAIAHVLVECLSRVDENIPALRGTRVSKISQRSILIKFAAWLNSRQRRVHTHIPQTRNALLVVLCALLSVGAFSLRRLPAVAETIIAFER